MDLSDVLRTQSFECSLLKRVLPRFWSIRFCWREYYVLFRKRLNLLEMLGSVEKKYYKKVYNI